MHGTHDGGSRRIRGTGRLLEAALWAVVAMGSQTGFSPRAHAQPRVPQLFADHMVLQRDMDVPVWGAANAGETVTVSLEGQTQTSTADPSGRWTVRLKPMKAGGPHVLSIAAGSKRIEIKDVLVGEVWLCSGQSNMGMGLEKGKPYAWNDMGVVNYPGEITAADYPMIRLASVYPQRTVRPRTEQSVKWEVCSPSTVAGFSAAAYFFGRELHKELNVPIGLIHSSFGGSNILPWIPETAIRGSTQLNAAATEIEHADQRHRKAQSDRLADYERWLGEARKNLADGNDAADPPRWPQHPRTTDGPCGLYNGMIHPLVPYALRGVIWYQGESDAIAGDGMLYLHKMDALIRGWRDVWNQGEFPFYYAQIASFGARYTGDNLALLREAQREAMRIPNTGMIVTTDISDLRNIHTPNKQDVGKRFALWALAKTYGRGDVVCSGPLFKAVKLEGDKLRVAFDYVGGGLASNDGRLLTHFEVAGADNQWRSATAVVDGADLLVSSVGLAQPRSVRFAWDMKAMPNLCNKEGLPASPFRAVSAQ